MRARNIKPAFCSDKALLKCSTEASLLFPMLWMIADREGRLEDDPEQIALDSYFVVRGIEVDPLLGELLKHGLIIRYDINGEKYIQIKHFSKHQNPHKREAFSVIPPPPEELPGQPSNYRASPADSGSLIPDSGSLIPDSPPYPPKGEAIPFEEILQAYKSQLPDLPQPQGLNDKRKSAIRQRLKEDKDRQAVEWWSDYFHGVNNMPHLMGDNGRGWTAGFDWLLNPTNMLKVLEGNYLRRKEDPNGRPAPSQEIIDRYKNVPGGIRTG
jgi:hypothetical protein